MRALVGTWRGGRAPFASIGAAAFLFLACGVSQGVAAPIIYGDFLGNTVTFLNVREDSATDPTPLYRQPTVTDDTLVFHPSVSFSSMATNGAADVTDGRLNFTVQADRGQFIQTISIAEFGDFSLIATTGATASANVSGAIFGTDNVTNTMSQALFVETGGSPLSSAPFTVTGPGGESGAFTGAATLDYTGQHVRRVRIVLDNTLATAADPAAAAFISKKGFSVTVTTPEPASLALMGLGALAMLPRRRRRQRQAM